MTENEVINKIYGYLKNQNEHIIMENMTNESVIYDDFPAYEVICGLLHFNDRSF